MDIDGLGRISARLAHELRTPLMLPRMRVEHASPEMPPVFQENLQDELARFARFVERALLAAKAAQGSRQAADAPLCLSDMVRHVTGDYQLLASERALAIDVRITDDIQIHADSDLLLQTLHELLGNGLR